jgi:hypothetical protein
MSKDFSNLLGGALANKQASESSVRDRIVVRDDLRELIPQLASEELQQLEQNILKEGVRDPLIIWPVGETFVLVDGHNRFSICKRNNLEFPIRKIDFKDEDEVKDWMIRNQLGRRNLSPEQQSYLRGLRYLRERGTSTVAGKLMGQNDPRPKIDTSERLAAEYNVSPKTIKRDGQFAKGVDLIGASNPELKKDLLEGKSKLSKREIEHVAKNPESLDSIVGKEIESSSRLINKTKKMTSVLETASIALAYIKIEKRDYNDVVKHLGFTDDDFSPVEFLIKWNENQVPKDNL